MNAVSILHPFPTGLFRAFTEHRVNIVNTDFPRHQIHFNLVFRVHYFFQNHTSFLDKCHFLKNKNQERGKGLSKKIVT